METSESSVIDRIMGKSIAKGVEEEDLRAGCRLASHLCSARKRPVLRTVSLRHREKDIFKEFS